MPSVLMNKMQNQSQESNYENNKNTDNNDNYSANQLTAIRCGGCGDKIRDRYYLLAVDKQWHCRCLKCCHCGQQLESELTCFARHGLIYCKQDYYKLFSYQKCVRCLQPIQPKQLVMRISTDSEASDYYHVDCFTCATCAEMLRKGDYFGKFNNYIYCRHHFQQLLDARAADNHLNHHNHHERPIHSALDPDSCDKKLFKSIDDSYHQKPKIYKKRKTKLSQKFIDKLSSISKASSPIGSSCECPSTPSTLLSLSLSSLKRPKRNRTSFKHQQLRAMKQYFNLNHNPDSKDLKQLSLRTGLSKRVLQVWFQNQRAKWRRSLIRQQSLGPQIVQECQPLTELNEYALSCDEEQTIVEEEQAFVTYTDLY